MKLTTDQDNNVGYLQLPDEIGYGEVARTIMVDLIEGSQIQIDIDKRGAILGFEFLDIATQLAVLKDDFSLRRQTHPSCPSCGAKNVVVSGGRCIHCCD